VSSSGSHTVSVIDVSGAGNSESVVITPAGGRSLTGIAVSPDGSHAYVADAPANEVTEIGNAVTLTVAIAGTGLGSVTSTPSGISCGTACQVHLPRGTSVALNALVGGLLWPVVYAIKYPGTFAGALLTLLGVVGRRLRRRFRLAPRPC